LFSAAGRGIPDIAALAVDFYFIRNNAGFTVDGTSCAAPVRLPPRSVSSTQLTTSVQTVAGIISLLNDYRLSRGDPPLGFLNPWLYDLDPAVLNDITSGSNPGCGTGGFSAIVGWDPVRPTRLVSLHFRRWLIFGSAGDGSRDAGLFEPAGTLASDSID